MAFWSKVAGKIEKHDGRQPKLWAIFRINVAHNVESIPLTSCALYKKDPERYPDTPDILPEELEKVRQKQMAKQLRQIMKGRRRT